MRIPLHDVEALRYYFKAYQIPVEIEKKREDEFDYEKDEDFYHIEQHSDWEKSLIKHHQYKPQTIQALQRAYDTGAYETLADARESL